MANGPVLGWVSAALAAAAIVAVSILVESPVLRTVLLVAALLGGWAFILYAAGAGSPIGAPPRGGVFERRRHHALRALTVTILARIQLLNSVAIAGAQGAISRGEMEDKMEALEQEMLELVGKIRRVAATQPKAERVAAASPPEEVPASTADPAGADREAREGGNRVEEPGPGGSEGGERVGPS